MAHFAKLDTDGTVLSVLVVSNEDILDPENNESEVLGQTLLFNLTGHRLWKQTSYNGTFRKNFAGIGYKYDEGRDAFISPKPYPSWVLDEQTCNYVSPIEYPSDGNRYLWNEQEIKWDLI